MRGRIRDRVWCFYSGFDLGLIEFKGKVRRVRRVFGRDVVGLDGEKVRGFG